MQHRHESHTQEKGPVPGTVALALRATLHCLLGCGIGEVAGMIFSTFLGLGNLQSVLLSVILGFIGGLALGIVPFMKLGWGVKRALRTVIAGEGLSIAVMEAFEVLAEMSIPGVMSASLTDGIFWVGMVAALAIGFMAA